MRSIVTTTIVAVSVLTLASLGGCKKKGLPEECEQYLAQYQCFLDKSGATGVDATIEGMRTTWTQSASTPAARPAIVSACQQSQAQMASKFAESGCTAQK